jgi:hypothetical protein
MKITPVLPEKLLDRAKDAAFAPRAPAPEVPGTLNHPFDPKDFVKAFVRPQDVKVGTWLITCDIFGIGKTSKSIILRKDFYQKELLSVALASETFEDFERVKIIRKPAKLEDGAVYKLERFALVAKVSLVVHTWDGGIRRCGIETSPTATKEEIVREAQKKLDDTKLESPDMYTILFNGNPTAAPWREKTYDLMLTGKVNGTVTVHGRFGSMTVNVPIHQPEFWQRIVYDALPDDPLTVNKIGEFEFRAIYAEEEKEFSVQYITDDAGEEHTISLLPLWENQVLRVRQAFGRDMIPDDSRAPKDGVLYVKAADGSPPDPTFDRIMSYTLGEESTEHQIRVHKGTTTLEVKAELSRLHSGLNPDEILFEGSAMADEDPVNEWATTTGTSPLKVKVTLGTPTQKFSVWLMSGLRDLGEIELDGRPWDEIWREFRIRNTCLKERKEYRLYQGQERIGWEDLPKSNVTLVPKIIPKPERGSTFAMIDHHQVPRFREAGPLTQMGLQLHTMQGTEVTEVLTIHPPEEITLAQLVTYFILPLGIEFDVGSVFYWHLPLVKEESSSDPNKKKPQEIPYNIPIGFTLHVKCSSLKDHSNKKMAHCRWQGIIMPFQMHKKDTLDRLKGRAAEWLRLQGQGDQWTILGNDREAIDFEATYDIIPLNVEAPITIFLKQRPIQVLPSMSWINLSDQLTKRKQLPDAALFRIYPVTGSVDDKDPVDLSYTVAWEEGKQYWFDIILDESRNLKGHARQITMVDYAGHAESFVVPSNATD